MHFRSLPFSRCFASSLHRTSSTVLIHMVIAFDGFKLQLSSAQLSNQPIFRALVCFNSMKWNGRKLVVRNVSYHIKYWKYCRAKRQRKTALMFPVTASRRATACFQLLSLLPVISIRQQKKRRNNCIECKWLWSVNIITISTHTHTRMLVCWAHTPSNGNKSYSFSFRFSWLLISLAELACFGFVLCA